MVCRGGVCRSQCASRNTAKLSSFPAHPHLSCTKCKGRLRVWPAQGPKFTCDSPANICPLGDKARQSLAQQNRYRGSSCCPSFSPSCTSSSLLGTASFDSYTSIMLDTDHIQLIDESPGYDKDLTPESCTWPVSYTRDHDRSWSIVMPLHRRSVVSCNPQPYQVLNASVPKKQLDSLSPDVFHLRAPLVSWENFMTPAGSAETIFDTLDETKLENRQ